MLAQRFDVGVGDGGRRAGELLGVGQQCPVRQREARRIDVATSGGAGGLAVGGSLRPQEEGVGDRSVVAAQDR